MLVRFLLTALLLGLPVYQANALEEGVDFVALTQPQPTETDGKVEVLEFFWYGCPHCWHLEPLLKLWKDRMPANAQFRRFPAILGPHWEPLARAYFAAELMGKVEQLHDALFEAVQVKKERLTDADSIAKFVATQGVDPDAFKEAYNSFFVDMQVRKSKELGKAYGIDGVPTIIVDGKYRTGAGMAGGNEQMLLVVDDLIKKAAADKGAESGIAAQ